MSGAKTIIFFPHVNARNNSSGQEEDMAARRIFQRIGAKSALCLFMVVAADALFYDQPVGWTLGLYAGLVLGCIVLANINLIATGLGRLLALAALILAINIFDRPNILSILMFIFLLAVLLVSGKRAVLDDVRIWALDIWCLLGRLFLQWRFDWKLFAKLRKSKKIMASGFVRYTVLPVCLAVMFSYLFSLANPVIASYFRQFDISALWSFSRLLFWVYFGALIWGLLRPRFALSRAGGARAFTRTHENIDMWLSENSLKISLLVFNLMFAVQNGLDIAFLWGRGTLPDGVSYAHYARAGAYPLIATTLIAAVYVLVAFGDARAGRNDIYARAGVYVWIAQNVFLAFSAMARLVAYIDAYKLTYLRTAALVWIGLIIIGMALIIARIYLRKDNRWLTNVNALVLVTVLYICSFVNFGRFIADYNVNRGLTHAAEGVPRVDIGYLRHIGPDAIPGLQKLLQQNPPYATVIDQEIKALTHKLVLQQEGNWRSWTWQRARLRDEVRQPD